MGVHWDAFASNGLLCKDGLLSSWGLGGIADNFLITFMTFTVLGLTIVFITSGPLFYFYYWPSQVTFEKWQYKSNPKFPSPQKVRDEIVQMCKSVCTAMICPSLSVWLAYRGSSKAFCGTPDGFTWKYHVVTFLAIWVCSDFYEFFYHWCGHRFKFLWEQHKYHHVFFNPSPFAVIADEMVDQFVRAGPLLLFPLLVPINIDLMFLEFGLFFYVYGCYLHWGYELDCVDAHNPIMNTAFQHYCHHAKSIIGKTYHCGFFFKIWDNMFGSVYPLEEYKEGMKTEDGMKPQEGKMICFCVKCERKKGNRSPELFKQVEVPEYSVLLQPSFWTQKGVLSGATSMDKNK